MEKAASWFVLIGMCAAFFSCSPHWHLSKACNKLPDLCEVDTFIREVTIINEKPKLDTVFIPKWDTTYVFHNRDSVIIRYRVSHDTVSIEAECPPEKEIIKVIEKPVLIPEPVKWWHKLGWYGWAAIGFVLGVVALIVMKLVK